MQICVILPSQPALDRGHAQARWATVQERLRALGHGLTFELPDLLRSPSQMAHDVYLFSDRLDTRVHVVAYLLEDSNKLLGIDIDGGGGGAIDLHLLRALAPCTDFFIGSSDQMVARAGQALIDRPGYKLPLPCPRPMTGKELIEAVARRTEAAWRERRLSLGLVLNGTNPPGQALAGLGHALSQLIHAGWSSDLQVLVDGPITTDLLEHLSRLPLPAAAAAWSPGAEQRLHTDSTVIAVATDGAGSARPLALARAALAAGAQVLALAPAPPWLDARDGSGGEDMLDTLVYRDIGALLCDLRQHKLRLRDDTVPGLLTQLDTACNPQLAAQSLFASPQDPQPKRRPTRPKQVLGIVHGVRSDNTTHQLAQRAKQLSIASPFAKPGLNYDVRFTVVAGQLQVQLSEAAATLVRPELRRALMPAASESGRAVKLLSASPHFPQPAAALAFALAARTQAERLACYGATQEAVAALMLGLLDRVRLVLSESEPPFAAEGFA